MTDGTSCNVVPFPPAPAHPNAAAAPTASAVSPAALRPTPDPWPWPLDPLPIARYEVEPLPPPLPGELLEPTQYGLLSASQVRWLMEQEDRAYARLFAVGVLERIDWSCDGKEAQPGWQDPAPARYLRNGFMTDIPLEVALAVLAEEVACRKWSLPGHALNNCGLTLPAIRHLVGQHLHEYFDVERVPVDKVMRSALRAARWHNGTTWVRKDSGPYSAPRARQPVSVWWPDRADAQPLLGRVTPERWQAKRRTPLTLYPPCDAKRERNRMRLLGWTVHEFQRAAFDPTIELYWPPKPFNASI